MAEDVSVLTPNLDIASNEEGAVRHGPNRRRFRHRFLGLAVQPPEVEGAGWTTHDRFGNGIGRRTIDVDPGAISGDEDLRQAADAVGGVDAVFRLPLNRDLIGAILPSRTSLLFLHGDCTPCQLNDSWNLSG
jgi:hypothetical protein